jgi:hypothetical protein
MIKAGDLVTFKKAYQDDGDNGFMFFAVDDEEKGRVTIEAEIGMKINPRQVVSVFMIEGQEGWIAQ